MRGSATVWRDAERSDERNQRGERGVQEGTHTHAEEDAHTWRAHSARRSVRQENRWEEEGYR